MRTEDFVLKTERLALRRLGQEDFEALCKILQDAVAMRAYEHAFSDAEVQEWLDRQMGRYQEYGLGLWAVILQQSGELIGQCGLTWQDCAGKQVLEVGYLFQRAYWHQGYAIEAAAACRDYAFETVGVDEVFSIIRDNNLPSQNVAKRNGMSVRGCFVKHYYGVDMPHLVFSVRREEWDSITVREYRREDIPILREIWNEVVSEGNAFPQTEPLSLQEAEDFFSSQSFTGVAQQKGKIAGLYILHPNNVGRCGHIANASYAVSGLHRGAGFGEQLVRHSLQKGKELGFQLMQFNAVVKSNERAIHLYQKLGFVRLGEIPGGFQMKDGSYEDILLFYHPL